MPRYLPIILCGWLLAGVAVRADAQVLPGYDTTLSYTRLEIGEKRQS